MKTGLFKEVLVMALDSIRSNKLRAFLTILGIVIGILTIVAMVAVIEGINTSFSEELEAMGSNVLFVSKYEPGIHMGRLPEEIRKRKDLTYDDAEAISELCPSVEYATPYQEYFRVNPPLRVKYMENEVENMQLLGANHHFLNIYDYYGIESGRFFTEAENRNGSEVCILGADIVDSLFPHLNPLHKSITLDNHRMRIIGILSREGKFLGQSRDNVVILPINTFHRYFPNDKEVTVITKISSTSNLDKATQEIINVMRARRKVKISKDNDFSVFTQDTLSNLFNQLTGGAFLVMIVISCIALLVGGIGVMNIMLVSVKERTKEIGLRKALGAQKKEIRRQFLFEAMILTGTGGVIGMIAGFLISFLLRAATKLPVTVNLFSLITGFLVSTGVGLFFGLYPASQAANLDPVEALRYE